MRGADRPAEEAVGGGVRQGGESAGEQANSARSVGRDVTPGAPQYWTDIAVEERDREVGEGEERTAARNQGSQEQSAWTREHGWQQGQKQRPAHERTEPGQGGENGKIVRVQTIAAESQWQAVSYGEQPARDRREQEHCGQTVAGEGADECASGESEPASQ